MTVSAGVAAPGVDRAVVEQQYTQLYAELWDRLVVHIRYHLPMGHGGIAEDLAQETFILLWRRMLAGDEITHPMGLLRFWSKNIQANYFKAKSRVAYNAVDFTDPGTEPIVRHHTYAAGQPDMALVAAELDEAMEEMRNASAVWRRLHAEVYRYQRLVDGEEFGGWTPAVTRENERQQQLGKAQAQEVRSLSAFRYACRRVGALRAELEAQSPNWQSSTGMPPSAVDGGAKPGSVRSDLDVTVCPDGHRLTFGNLHFLENGGRRCRACAAKAGAAARDRAGRVRTRPTKPTTDPALFETARQMLTDPETDLTIPAVARALGLAPTTLYKNIPGLSELRRRAHQAYLSRFTQPALVSA
ncbi:RNA polymerase sigma factor [Streptomyces sp. sk226]|uniref:RNA polymerase sigma factor n=1 Tax=Streptomyces sp. sk226 TaxID=2034268 RepID=UPI000BEF7B8F|nr:sigma-70 family RNA polymerase sigma factor [Streptomyces sp. sk226]